MPSRYELLRSAAADPEGRSVLRDWCEERGLCPGCGSAAELQLEHHGAACPSISGVIAGMIVDDLAARYPRAQARRLTRGAVRAFLDEHARHAAARAPDETIASSVVGGYVPSSYGYPGDTDRVDVVTDAGGTTIAASRQRAQIRAGGRGQVALHRALRPGQTRGRILP